MLIAITIIVDEVTLILQYAPGLDEQLVPDDPIRPPFRSTPDLTNEIRTQNARWVRMSRQLNLVVFCKSLQFGRDYAATFEVDLHEVGLELRLVEQREEHVGLEVAQAYGVDIVFKQFFG